MITLRHTVGDTVVFAGRGLHGGEPVTVRVHPGENGIRFRHRADVFPADPFAVSDTRRCTCLGPIATVEHLMAALAGLEITDAEIEVDGNEIPGMDGSAQPFVDGLLGAGITAVGEREIPPLFRRLFLQEDLIKIAIGRGEGTWRYEYRLADRWPGEMIYEASELPSPFPSDIAAARTFGLIEEVPMIIQMGLARGLDEDGALILGEDGYKNESRFPDEPARHKLLDLIGDLYLAQVPIRCLNVVAERSGHRTNVEAARMLATAMAEAKSS